MKQSRNIILVIQTVAAVLMIGALAWGFRKKAA